MSPSTTQAESPPRTPVATMKALVFHGVGQRAWEDKPRPVLRDPTDAIVRVTAATICGTDLHILKGDVPEVEPASKEGDAR